MVAVMSNTHRRRDETVELRRVGGSHRRRDKTVASAVWTHPSAVVTQFTIPCADNWQVTHNDVIVEKIVKKVHEYYTTQQIRMFTNMQRHMLRHILLL